MNQREIKKELKRLLKIEMESIFGIFKNGEQLDRKKFEKILKTRLRVLHYKQERETASYISTKEITTINGDMVLSEFATYSDGYGVVLVIIDSEGASYCTVHKDRKIKNTVTI